MLHLDRKEYLMDEYVPISVSGLQPMQHVTLRCEVTEGKFVFDGHAHYVASLDGVMDVSCDASFGGNYKGISQMGIFSSMIPATGQMQGLRYFPRECMKPMEYKLQVYDGHVGEESFKRSVLLPPPANSSATRQPMMEGVVLRKCNGDGVTRHEVKEGRVRGTIFKPPGDGPFKGVIDIYGGAGGINESRVCLLASRGFIAFTLPHHRYDDLVETFAELEIEYFLEAIHYFSSLSTVQPNLGLLGTCAGTGIVSFLSTICPQLSTVIGFGPAYCFVAPISYQGETLACFHDIDPVEVGYTRGMLTDDRGGKYFNSLYHTPFDDIAIRIEQSHVQFLLIAGTDDKSMNALPSGKYMVNRMKKHGKGSQITLLNYPGVGHFVDPPFMPQTLLQYNPSYKYVAAVGGNMVETASASVHCWRETLSFLNRNVGNVSKL